MTTRTLDWKPRFDERSKKYPIRGTVLRRPKRVDKMWTTGPILDQGTEGACVGFGWTAQTTAAPFSTNIRTVKIPKSPTTPTRYAQYVYETAKKIDEYPGEDYEGTSVLAGAKVLEKDQLLKSYAWGFTIDDVIDGIIARGPVVLGIPWYDGMYEAPGGVLTVSGNLVGGHCIVAVGYKVSSAKLNGEAAVVLQNSWGRKWGKSGLAEIRVSELSRLLKEQGEACLPLKVGYRASKWVGLVEKIRSAFGRLVD